MYTQFRKVNTTAIEKTASTPIMWPDNFKSSGKMSLYHRIVFRLDHRWKIIQRSVKPGGRILDAGCGAGEWVAFLNEMSYDAEGLDYSDELVGRIRQMYPQDRRQHGAIQAMPYADSSMDAVISWGVIEHDEAGPDRPGGVSPHTRRRRRRHCHCAD